MKKNLLLATSLSLLSSFAFAEMYEDEAMEPDSYEFVSAEDENLSSDDFIVDQYDSSSDSQSMDSTGSDSSTPMTTTTTSASSSRGYNFAFPDQENQAYAQVDFLYWTVSEAGLYYALTKDEQVTGVGETAGDGGSGSILGNGSRHDVDFDWSPGVRALLGYAFKDTPWYLDGEYTYFNTNKKQTVDQPSGSFGYVTGLSLQQGTGTDCAEVESKIHFQYQMARMMFGAGWHPLKNLGINLAIGPRFSIVEQKWDVEYFSDGSTGTANEKNTLNWSYWGGGINAMVGVNAILGMGFAIDSGAGISAVYGPFQSHYKSQRQVIGGAYSESFDISRSNYSEVLWESQLYADLSWSYHLPEVAFRVSLGYEFNVLENINEQLRSTGVFDTVNSASYVMDVSKPIYLHGLVATFGVGF